MIDGVINSRLVKVVKRYVPLIMSIWIIVDVALDIYQTSTYREHAFDVNGTYHQWSEKYGIRNVSGVDHLQKVSPLYFYVSCMVWGTPPFLCSMFYYSIYFCLNGFSITNFFVVLCFPVAVIVASLFIYIVIPLASLQSSLIIARKGSINDNKVLLGCTFNTNTFTWLNLFEHIGEALPQIILAVVFSSNNYSFLRVHDTSIVPVPTTIISIFFSFGSLCMGMYTGISAF